MVWNAFLENEEVQALTESKMKELIEVIKEKRLHEKQSKGVLEDFGEKNYLVMYHEIKLIETQYLQMWEKFNENKAYTEMFLGISGCLSVLYLEYDRLEIQITKGTRPILHKQKKLLFKRIRLEEKYENSSEILKERKKIQDFKNDLYNKRIREEINLLLPESISSSRLDLKITRKEFLQLWKKYMLNSKLKKEFLICSYEHAKLLSKVKTLEAKIRKFGKEKPYRQMLRENYTRYSILEDKLLDTWRNK
jgi:hypothetical protein